MQVPGRGAAAGSRAVQLANLSAPPPMAESVPTPGLHPRASIFHTPNRMSFLRGESGLKHLTRSRYLPAKGTLQQAEKASLPPMGSLPLTPHAEHSAGPFPIPHTKPLPVVLPTWDAHLLTTGNHLEDPGCAKVSHASTVPHRPPPSLGSCLPPVEGRQGPQRHQGLICEPVNAPYMATETLQR